MPFNQYPFLRYVLFFFLGVWVYPHTLFLPGYFWFGAAFTLLLVYAGLMYCDLRLRTYFYIHLMPLSAYGILAFAGIAFAHQKDVQNDPAHLLFQGELEGYVAAVKEMDDPKAKWVANRVELLAVRRKGQFYPAKGIVMLYHSGESALSPGDVVYLPGTPGRIAPPENPGEFDYRRFMERQQVYHRHFVNGPVNLLKEKQPLRLTQQMAVLRERLSRRMDLYLQRSEANQIAKALLLGQKSSMESDMKEAYATAGAMHVLAVSGLHVGIVYGFFFLFWKPQRLNFFRRVLLLSLVICLIWSYAMITGMSPSVMRAATMFTFVALAQMRSRSPSIFNPLALSALLLVLYDPFIFYAVGFQLSYAALLGILVFQPVIVSWWTPSSKMVDYFWQIASVSMAAQLATFPLTLHYFHSFPTYFLLSNLVAIPGAFAIMALGIPFLLLSFIPILGLWLGTLLEWTVYLFNGLIYAVQYLPKAKLEHLYLDTVEMALTWIVLAMLFWWLGERGMRAYRLTMVAIIILVGYRFWILAGGYYSEDQVVYRLKKGTAVDWYHQGSLYAYQKGVSEDEFRYMILPNRIRRGHSKPIPLRAFEVNGETYLLSPNGDLVWLDLERGSLMPKRYEYLQSIQEGPYTQSGVSGEQKEFVD
ncbi:MAG: ComEC/Rec2 family competence protein [Lunatimonas sp.]|uniref:ComEC/Rec2 family competence protein n=1 Tax=Lunatimonas sp. TaxID=2060141 RepID=UPI00263B74E1|nr:ComEC/Rec2 family competence protein [Lunatimonas sp.]MCC5939077.1 ComEC/Rec2 family competence protein [Lunatimonas sp.]